MPLQRGGEAVVGIGGEVEHCRDFRELKVARATAKQLAQHLVLT